MYNKCYYKYIKEVDISMTCKKKLIAIRLKPSTLEKIKVLAESREESVSEYIRKLLETHLLMQ